MSELLLVCFGSAGRFIILDMLPSPSLFHNEVLPACGAENFGERELQDIPNLQYRNRYIGTGVILAHIVVSLFHCRQ